MTRNSGRKNNRQFNRQFDRTPPRCLLVGGERSGPCSPGESCDLSRRKDHQGPSGASGVAVSSRYIYWSDETAGTIGRARLDGTHVRQRLITTHPSTNRIGLFGLTVDPGQ
jgi:hypothetical protein